MLGLVSRYNMLPEYIVGSPSVKVFQRKIQEMMKERALADCNDWADTFSPRIAMFEHPLR